jgi:hypothetical protein
MNLMNYFLPGFGKCKASKRLETPQKKLLPEHNLGHKQINRQQDSLPLKHQNVPEASGGGMSLCSASVV